MKTFLTVCAAWATLCATIASAAFTTTGEVIPSDPATWDNSTIAYIGKTTEGTLTVDGNSDLLSVAGYLGCDRGSTGTVSVEGAGSTWNVSSDFFYVGLSGSGNLNISSGGSASSLSTWVGNDIGSTGMVTLEGTDSTWTPSALTVGVAGTGIVTQTGGINNANLGGLGLGVYSSGKGIYNLNGGTLVVGNLQKGNGTAEFNFGGGTLQIGSNWWQSSNMPITLTGIGGDANIDTAGYSAVFYGGFSGLGGMNKRGNGTLTLDGENLYSGTTTISAGTLTLGGNYGSINSTSLIDVQSGATFDVRSKTGGFTLGGAQILKGGGTIVCPVVAPVIAAVGSRTEPGDGVGTLTLTGNLTLSAGALLDFELADVGASDKISMTTSTLNLNGQQFADFTFHPFAGFGPGSYLLIDAGTIQGDLDLSHCSGLIGGYTGTLIKSGNDLVLTVVPEPDVWGLLATGIGGLGFLLRKKKRTTI